MPLFNHTTAHHAAHSLTQDQMRQQLEGAAVPNRKLLLQHQGNSTLPNIKHRPTSGRGRHSPSKLPFVCLLGFERMLLLKHRGNSTLPNIKHRPHIWPRHALTLHASSCLPPGLWLCLLRGGQQSALDWAGSSLGPVPVPRAWASHSTPAVLP